MTDIHSHILFDVDDGSRNIDESIELLKKMYDGTAWLSVQKILGG